RLARRSEGRAVSLADLATHHGEHPLLIVSDGEGLINPLSGTVQPWLAELFSFPTVVLLTPVPLRRWSWRERTLAAAGLVVLPATPEGVATLGAFLASGGEPPQPALQRRPAALSIIGREGTRSLRWLFDAVPEESEREALIAALFRELSPSAFELLCALAVFPQIHLDVTLHLGLALRKNDGTPLLDEMALGALARLPWLRLGRMPD